MNFIYYLENKLKYFPWAQKIFFQRKIQRDFPPSLNIELTNLCNLDCLMCPRKKGNRGLGMMDFEFYREIIGQITKSGYRLYVLTLIKDGEPLLYSRLGEAITLAKEKNVAHRVEIFTNGVLLDKDWAKSLINSGLDVLTVSVNAATHKTYENLTKSKYFDIVVNNLRRFMRIKGKGRPPLTTAKIIKMKETEGEVEIFRKIWQGVVDQILVAPSHNYGGGVLKRSDLIGCPTSPERWPCLVLWFNPVVNFNGEVTTCCANYLRNELIMGDLKKESLGQIWQSVKYRKLRHDHLVGDLTYWPTCQKCNYFKNFVNLTDWLKKHEEKT